VTMKNVAFCDIEAQFVPHRRHITSPLQSSASSCYVRFEVLTAVTTKNALRRLLVTASVVPSSSILVVLIKEALSSSETSGLTRATRRNIQEDAIFLCIYHNG
jgi:hypothetical protein